jgi:hypothetical protein
MAHEDHDHARSRGALRGVDANAGVSVAASPRGVSGKTTTSAAIAAGGGGDTEVKEWKVRAVTRGVCVAFARRFERARVGSSG